MYNKIKLSFLIQTLTDDCMFKHILVMRVTDKFQINLKIINIILFLNKYI